MTFMERWFEEVWNKGRESAIDEMADPHAVAHGLGENGGDAIGVDAFKEFFRSYRAAMSDIHIAVEDSITQGDLTAARVRVTAKHTGHQLGVPAKGNAIDITGITMARLKDGKLVEAWNYFEFPKMYQQMA